VIEHATARKVKLSREPPVCRAAAHDRNISEPTGVSRQAVGQLQPAMPYYSVRIDADAPSRAQMKRLSRSTARAGGLARTPARRPHR
jgi:hypothetical protein